MKRFYLAGQNNFGNRGCEALVRSTLQLLQDEFGEVEILVPSYRLDLDGKQWPNAPAAGCHFVRASPYPISLKIWGRIRRALPSIKNYYLPDFSPTADVRADIASCDAVLIIGGDNITLDYGIENLLFQIRFAQYAQRAGKPIMVWGASIGPFGKEPAIEQFVRSFLLGLASITVRETISQQYLASIGVVANVDLTVDGAFVMKPEPVDISRFWPKSEPGTYVVGLNVSPLIRKFRPIGEPENQLQSEIAKFVEKLLRTTKFAVLLIPHVDPLDGSTENSDSHFLRAILEMVNDSTGRLSIAPSTLNAPQLKYVLSQCTYFIGARTHATIGALSCLVPTISIAYSIKAKGLNRDLFGNEELVLETQKVSQDSLSQCFGVLLQRNMEIRAALADRIPLWRERAKLSPQAVARLLSTHDQHPAGK